MLAPTTDGTKAAVTWQSVAGVNYSIERGSDVKGPFTPLATGILGQSGTTTFNDAIAVGPGALFYQVSHP
jgi:hypothetical protein